MPRRPPCPSRPSRPRPLPIRPRPKPRPRPGREPGGPGGIGRMKPGSKDKWKRIKQGEE